ncbi:bactofilin family protein [Tenacibaculum agarivorans]|uniref:hypothetical protein n=1 Tax=Tenacibaculum agarivorans TaxID=1908389 RepID=UPI00094BB0B8|nr:hypothetical protein [Tenacibaculum agarivorans]
MWKWNKKVNAGALQYVLVVSVIILIILAAFIQLINVQHKIAQKNNLYKQAVFNVTNGFRYLSTQNLTYNTENQLKFSENEKEETLLYQKKWGLFDVVSITAKVNKERFQKIGLIGNQIQNKSAIYLTEKNTPLVLVGTTHIKGNAFLPKQGVKRGNIAGTSFYGNRLIHGNSYKSASHLPENNRIKQLENTTIVSTNNFELKEDMKLVQSFHKETLFYSDYQPIRLQNITLKGNIIITSNSKITVEKETVLEDIILKAPEIEIKSGVQGNFQAIATKKITVDNQVNLFYPSALVINYKKDKIEDDHGIFIGKKSDIKGGIVFLKKESKEISYFPQIKIEESAEVTGEVFCKGNVELLGNVKGEVYADNFITRQFGSVYINHIYNGSVNAINLPQQYVGLGISSNKKSVAKWLY